MDVFVRILLIGNSFTFYNGGIDAAFDSLSSSSFGFDGNVSRWAVPGVYLWTHRAFAESGQTQLSLWMEQPWDLLLLQDQSQNPGRPEDSALRQASVDALTEYFRPQIAAATGGRAMLFMTWGYHSGDDSNPDIYPDYLSMQQRLQDGYEQYLTLLVNTSHPDPNCTAFIIPIGLSFRNVFYTDDALFRSLYTDDLYHPAEPGTLLAASTLFAAVWGISPEGLPSPFPDIPAADVLLLQRIAFQTVLEYQTRYTYPYQCTSSSSSSSSSSVADADADADAAMRINK